MNRQKKLNKMIKTAKNFQYAINIGYDFSDEYKISNYIPTNDAIRIIEDVLLSTRVSSTDRARLFLGAYGKGKSHLALMLIALVYKKDIKLFKNLLEKIKEVNLDLYEYLNTYIKSDTRLLPVVIEGSKSSLQQSLLSALKSALDRENISDIMPNTYFNVAIDTIEMWKTNYQDTYSQFGNLIDCSVNDFINQLKNFDSSALDVFSKIYPRLTAGSIFSPILNGDVVALYSDVINEIEKYGYNGIFLVYDEFSKYLEGNVNTTTAVDIKVLQDLAEKANRSGSKQLHLLMISHKNIINYVDELPKVKVDAWKAVSERFKTVELSNSPIQLYKLITRVIVKDQKLFDKYLAENSDKFQELVNTYLNRNMFAGIARAELDAIIKGCFPLEPTSLFILPNFSEKVAQNERSMFTFLSSKNDKNALYNLIERNNDFITPDFIFDYFEEQLKNEAYTSDTYKLWKLALTSINLIKGADELSIKLIKCLAIIYMLDKKEIVRPTSDNLVEIYSIWGYKRSEITDVIEKLKEIGVFKYSTRTHYLRLSERTDVNIDEIIRDTIERRKGIFDPVNILNDVACKTYIYPNRYNDINEIIRYFTFEFITKAQCLEIVDWDKRIEDNYATGTLFAVYNSEDITNTEWLEKIVNKRVLFGLIKEPNNIEQILSQYDALSYLINNADDDLFKEELLYVYEDVQVLLNKYFNSYLNPVKHSVAYFYKGKQVSLNRKSQLSSLLSNICEEIYLKSPVIVNEVINKNKVTRQAINSRNKVLQGLLENEVRENLGLTGNGQDISFFRSIVKNTNVYSKEDGNCFIITEKLPDENLNYTLRVIKDFFLTTTDDKAKNLDLLYDELTSCTVGIGMKLGLIPFFIAAVLHHYKKYTVITKKGKELPITPSLLDSINENPGQYELKLELWTQEKELYIKELENVFEAYLVISEKEYNTFDYIVKAMQRWFLRLPKYSKEADILGDIKNTDIKAKSIKRFRQNLKAPEINAREFLFDKLPKLFGSSEVNVSLAKKIKISKDVIDDLIIELQENIEDVIYEELTASKDHQAPLYTVAKDWYEGLENKTKEYLFKNGEGKLLTIIGSVHSDISGFVKKVSREVTGLYIEDWNDNTFEKFTETLKSQIASISAFNNDSTNDQKSTQYKIVVTDEEGNKVEKNFDMTAISGRGKMLYNELLSNMNDYGNALTEGEKRQILMNVMIGYLK